MQDHGQFKDLWQKWLVILKMQDNTNLSQMTPKIYLINQDHDQYETWCIELLEHKICPNIQELYIDFAEKDVISRLYTYVLPIIWLALAKLKKQSRIIIGLNGMQGSGKTTLGGLMKWIFNKIDIKFDSLSLDDFYLDYATRKQMDPQLFKYRGPPGTHSVDLLSQFVNSFKQGGEQLQVSNFDKSLNQGQGDRTGYRTMEQGVQVVLLEGWMYGFRAVEDEIIQEKITSGSLPLPHGTGFVQIEFLQVAKFFNQELRKYHSIWDQHDLFFVLVPTDHNFSVQWRIQAEHKMRAKTGNGMSDEEVITFVSWYWTAMHPDIYVNNIFYEQYSDTIMKCNESRGCKLSV